MVVIGDFHVNGILVVLVVIMVWSSDAMDIMVMSKKDSIYCNSEDLMCIW